MKTLRAVIGILTLAFIIVLSIFFYAAGQSISVAPTSFKAWGGTQGYFSASVSYKNVGVHYFHPYKRYYWRSDNLHEIRLGRLDGVYDPVTVPAFAVSYKPISIKDIIKAGIIVFDKPFPIRAAQRVNFILEAGYTFDFIRLSYVHHSNGFGLINDINPGLDMIKISFLFNN